MLVYKLENVDFVTLTLYFFNCVGFLLKALCSTYTFSKTYFDFLIFSVKRCFSFSSLKLYVLQIKIISIINDTSILKFG
jgi:hypothetical protein